MFIAEAIGTVFFKKYASFNGRASRSEFWWAWLFFYVPIALILTALQPAGGLSFWWLAALWSIQPPFWAVTTRRLHDSGCTGWLALAWFLSVNIWVLVGQWLAAVSVQTFMGGQVTIQTNPLGGQITIQTSPLPAWGTILWYLFVVFVIVFAFIMLWHMCRPGDSGSNAYGPPPGSGTGVPARKGFDGKRFCAALLFLVVSGASIIFLGYGFFFGKPIDDPDKIRLLTGVSGLCGTSFLLGCDWIRRAF